MLSNLKNMKTWNLLIGYIFHSPAYVTNKKIEGEKKKNFFQIKVIRKPTSSFPAASLTWIIIWHIMDMKLFYSPWWLLFWRDLERAIGKYNRILQK